MGLLEPRKGISAGFQVYRYRSSESTIGPPEQIIWSSIKHLCASEVVDGLLYTVHRITSKRVRSRIASNLKLYIRHAFQFYECAEHAKADTAPVLYYYSFLNLAKALCEINHPGFHRRPESYRHGISWRANPDYLVHMPTESVSLSTRGVWHVLWESLMKRRIAIPNPVKLRVKELFALCPEISVEYERTFGESARFVTLLAPDMLYDPHKNEFWVSFSISRDALKELRLSRPKFLQLISDGYDCYKQVRARERDLWAFELATPKSITPKHKGRPHGLVDSEMKAMNLFVHLGDDELFYSVPVQTRVPIVLPQLIVLYTLMFWLGSLVRYDPYSVADLQESRYWILIDGFLSQSRPWLVELFEWEFYQTETYLWSTR